MAESGKVAVVQQLDDSSHALSDDARYLYRELGIPNAQLPLHGATNDREALDRVPASLLHHVEAGNSSEENNTLVMQHGSKQLALLTTIDIAVFFIVLLVGFAYVWKRGDLDWVRASNNNQPDP
jgi:NADH-quinone oxidoreductase subunit A